MAKCFHCKGAAPSGFACSGCGLITCRECHDPHCPGDDLTPLDKLELLSEEIDKDLQPLRDLLKKTKDVDWPRFRTFMRIIASRPT